MNHKPRIFCTFLCCIAFSGAVGSDIDADNDGTIDTTPSQQTCVGRVYNGIHPQSGDIRVNGLHHSRVPALRAIRAVFAESSREQLHL